MGDIPGRGIVRITSLPFVIVLAMSLLAPNVLRGQVTIREKVVIREDSLVSSPSGAKTTSVITAPYDGWFKVYFDNAYKLLENIFATAEMSFLRNGELEATDLIIQNNRLGTPSNGFQNYCTGGGDLSKIYATGSNPIWTAGRVLEGDQIQVSYDGKVGGFTYGTIYGVGPYWDIEAGALNCYSSPTNYVYNEVVFMTGIVVRDTLTIEIDDPKSVWPRIVRKDENPPTGLRRAAPKTFDLDSYLGSDSIGVTVTVKDQQTPISGAEVEVTAEWISNSGGHRHSDPPAGYMKFRDLQNPGNKVADAVTVTTDSNGEAVVRFFAPPWGGRARLHASTTYDSVELADVDSLTTKVPDLLPLADEAGASAMMPFIGGTCDHYGPNDRSEYADCQSPDDNHYGVSFTLSSLVKIDLDWAAKSQAQTDLPQGAQAQTPLQVNDISLPFGGKFQEEGHWTRPTAHTFHQLGRDADLRTQRSSNPNQVFRVGIYVNTDTLTGEKLRRNVSFEEMIDEEFPGITARVHFGETKYEHYHLYFYGD